MDTFPQTWPFQINHSKLQNSQTPKCKNESNACKVVQCGHAVVNSDLQIDDVDRGRNCMTWTESNSIAVSGNLTDQDLVFHDVNVRSYVRLVPKQHHDETVSLTLSRKKRIVQDQYHNDKN